MSWIETAGYDSYDPYDIWGTRYSLLARRIYYRAGLLGLPLIAPILLLDLLCPGARRFFLGKQRYATADGQLALAFLNLHELTGQPAHLEKATVLCRDLINSAVPGYSGLCWGYPFDWQNNTALWKQDTPFITTGPYCFEAFLRAHEITGDDSFAQAAASVARFVHADLRDTPVGEDAAAASYSPIDHSKVINATAYRAYVLFAAAHQLGLPQYLDKAEKNLNFILRSQRADGSWLYALDSPGEAFIDHFHTCFVLKNLWKLNRHCGSEDVSAAIRKGYAYYRSALFDASGNPRSFAIEPRTQLVRLDLYNFAEAITLGALLREAIPEAFDLARELARRLHDDYQLPDGHFVTRVYRGGFRHTFPFLRWPQAQLFYALTNVLVALKGPSPVRSPQRTLPREAASCASTLSPQHATAPAPSSVLPRRSDRALLGLLRRRTAWCLSLRGWIALLSLLAVTGTGLLVGVHPFLAVTTTPTADALVVEGWMPSYTLDTVWKEYKAGGYKMIFTTGGPCRDGFNVEPGDNYAQMTAGRLKRLATPDDRIIAVPAPEAKTERTYSSAVALSDWIRTSQVQISSINVVTVGTHARRSRLLFGRALGPGMDVGVISIPNEEYEARRWWRHSEGIKEVISESAAYVHARLSVGKGFAGGRP